MLVDHLVYYLIHQDGMNWRDQDYAANKIVKCVKNEPFKGTFHLNVANSVRSFSFQNRADFLSLLWPHLAETIVGKLGGGAALVPIPNSDAIVDQPNEYKTLQYARAIAGHSKGQLVTVDAFRWREPQEPQHRVSGRRTPEQRFVNLCLREAPKGPIVLFDDFITSGSSLIAAHWRLADVHIAPTRAFVIGRRTEVQQEKMTGWVSEDLDIPWRPPFLE